MSRILDSRGRPMRRASGGRRRRRGRDSGGYGAFLSSYLGINRTNDSYLYAALDKIRARSRREVQSASIGSAWLYNITRHVIGGGLKVRSQYPKGAKAKTNPVASAIEKRWGEWARECTVTGESWWDVERHMLSSLVVDGEAYIALVMTPERELRVKVLDAGLVDTRHNERRGGGVVVKLGVEYNEDGRVTGYWLRGKADTLPNEDGYNTGMRYRVDAADVLRAAWRPLANMSRGVPVLAPVLTDIEQLRHYKTSEIVAARLGTRLAGYISNQPDDGMDAAEGSVEDDGESEDDDGDGDDGYEDEVSAAGYVDEGPEDWYLDNFGNGVVDNVGYGVNLKRLYDGETVTPFNSQHPTTAFGPFIDSMTRSTAAGLGVADHQISGNLSGVNFSSGRLGELGSRQTYKMIRTLLVNCLYRPFFERWAEHEGLRGNIPGRPNDIGKVDFVAEVPQHIQPKEVANANKTALENKTKSRTEIILEDGRDPGAVFEQLKMEEEMLGLTKPKDAGMVPDDEG